MMKFLNDNISLLVLVFACILAFDVQASGLEEDVISSSSSMSNSNGDWRYFEYGGRMRSYYIKVPDRLTKENGKYAAVNQGSPLVIVLHGGGGSALQIASQTKFTAKAYKEGFIVAYPNGTGVMPNRLLTWNVKHCCGYSMKRRVDDVGFISEVIDRIIQEQPVNPRRVYVMGMSNGGMLAYQVGSELSDKVTAIAPIMAGAFGDEMKPKNKVAIITMNGAKDKIFPFKGGQSDGRFKKAWDGSALKPYGFMGRIWAKNNKCTSFPRTALIDNSIKTEYVCPYGFNVKQYLFNDLKHDYPDDATDIIWGFFKKHIR